MYHIFCIHSSVDGHLGCFYVLVIVNNAAISYKLWGAFIFLYYIFSPDICPGMGLLDHMTILFLVF